jgi:hypothetical protein
MYYHTNWCDNTHNRKLIASLMLFISKKDSHNNRYMMVNKLMELDKAVSEEMRITPIHHIEKMRGNIRIKRNNAY